MTEIVLPTQHTHREKDKKKKQSTKINRSESQHSELKYQTFTDQFSHFLSATSILYVFHCNEDFKSANINCKTVFQA